MLWRRAGRQAALDARCKGRVVVAEPEYEVDDRGIALRFPVWTNDFHVLQSIYTGTGYAECLSGLFFLRVQSGRVVKLTAYLEMPRLRIPGVRSPF